MPGVFISYRREDSGYVGRLFDVLSAHFGRSNIFMDIDTIEGGEDFAAVIDEKIKECDALVAVIGKRWFEVDGQELSGTASYLGAGRGDRGILDGKIDGNRITFNTKSQTMLGDKTYEEKHHYGGTVEGDTIRFSLLTDSGYDSRTPEHFTATRVAALVSPGASSTP